MSNLKKIRVQHVDRNAEGIEVKTDVDVLTDADCITMDDGDLRSGVKKMIDDRIGEVIDGAPEQLDTLKEIAQELEKNQSGVSTILKKLEAKLDESVFDEKIQQLKSEDSKNFYNLLGQINTRIEKAAVTDDYTISRSDIIPSTKALSDGLNSYKYELREKASQKDLELYAKNNTVNNLSTKLRLLIASVKSKADKNEIADFKRCIVISVSDYAALSDDEKNRADTLYFLI